MGETPDRIAARIDAKRQSLYENMQELEHKVRCAMDWRMYVKRHPTVLTALVVAAGFLVARGVVRKH